MKAFAGWIGRKALVYIALVAAVAFYMLVWPRIAGEFSADDLRQDVSSAAELSEQFETLKSDAARELDARAAVIGKLGPEALADSLEAARNDLEIAKSKLDDDSGFVDSLRPSKIIARKRTEIEITVLERQIALLELAADRAKARQQLAQNARVPTKGAIAVATEQCAKWNEALKDFDSKYPAERGLRQILFNEREEIAQSRTKFCDAKVALTTRRNAGLKAAAAVRNTKQNYDNAASTASDALDTVASPEGRNMLRDILITAALLLIGILLVPLAIRIVFYFLLAPIAMRRPAIRIKVPESADSAEGVAIPPVQHSATSAPVMLVDGEELLVRQDYLQSLPESGSKRTRWLLDVRHPLSSIASGMTFLTCIKNTSEAVTISAVRDPFAEVAMLTIPAGGSCVLQPRALAALAQNTAEPVRITSHWRLFSLNAWLTLQLRYLVFHGPARLVVKGGRGVRVERAEQGRIFGQDQLVGFSAGLTYSVTRTETFWPYLIGRQPLFKDRVQGGSGSLILEESPASARGSSGPRGGLEGMMDAGLKAFGL